MKKTLPDHLNLPNAGWEVRVSLDHSFRAFSKGLDENASQKPVLVFLPKGASEILFIYLLGFLSMDGDVVCLVEDPNSAMAVDDFLSGAKSDERVHTHARIVIGTLESLAKTDVGCYRGCVVLAYGVDTEKSYLQTRMHLVTKLCGWNAHLLYVEQPLVHMPKEVLDGMTDQIKCDVIGIATVETVFSGMTAYLAKLSRRPTPICANFVGHGDHVATSYYIRLFRVSGSGRPRRNSLEAPVTIISTPSEAVRVYKKNVFRCLFMREDTFDGWVEKETEKETEKKESEPEGSEATETVS